MKKRLLVLLGIVVVAAAALLVIARPAPAPSAAPPAPLASKTALPASAQKHAYFGELHLHTAYSLDAFVFGAAATPRDAWRFAKGEAVWLPESQQYQQLRQPLDFAAITDHAESLGMYQQCNTSGSESYWSPYCIGLRLRLVVMFGKLVESYKQVGAVGGRYNAAVCGEDGALCKASARDLWKEIRDTANEAYEPGTFSSLIAFEYSPTLVSSGMLHRNVVFGSDAVPDTVFGSLDGFVEDLHRWLEANCQGACRVLSIPHNPNWSWGLMFGESNSDGTPLTHENRERRARLETLVEIMQVKGSSECAIGFGNTDEECGFETLWPVCTPEQLAVDPATALHAPHCVGPLDTVRNILEKGLLEQRELGFNPYKLGFVGATDNHNGTPGNTEESTWSGHGGKPDASAGKRLGIDKNMIADTLGFPLVGLNPGALTGVWAEENTREAIFDALARREGFATSGTRVSVRLFAGFELPAELHLQADAIATAMSAGVPMGGDLGVAGEGMSPAFLVQAMRDANSAPLAKIQIIKGWLSGDTTEERVYDVACSDGAVPDPATQRCPDNGATVDLADCSISTDKGVAELATTWRDPEFHADQAAFYYARVIENPVCRWSQHDALRLGVPHPEGFPATVRERAWTSPVWYNPPG